MINQPHAQAPFIHPTSQQDSKATHIVTNNNLQIRISAENVSELVQFMVTNQISFYLSSLPYAIAPQAVPDTMPPTGDVPKNSTLVSRPNDIITAVYEKYISNNFETSLPLIGEIANEFKVSTNFLKRKFVERYGRTMYNCYMEKRMQYAAELLKQGFKANAVSARMGYTAPIKFNKMFQKHFGTTPYQYRKTNT